MMRTLKLLLFGDRSSSEELEAIQKQIDVLENQARRLERDKKRLRIENHVTPRLEYIFTKGTK